MELALRFMCLLQKKKNGSKHPHACVAENMEPYTCREYSDLVWFRTVTDGTRHLV